jgi:DNA-directed RNA polymerase subunit RPC12/RpoP
VKTVSMTLFSGPAPSENWNVYFIHKNGGLCITCPECGFITGPGFNEKMKSGEVYKCYDCGKSTRLILN